MRLVEKLWRLLAAKRSRKPPDAKHKKKLFVKHSKTLPDEERKKKLAVRHNKTPPDAKLKKKLAAKHNKTPPDAKLKKKLAAKHNKTPRDEKFRKKIAEKRNKMRRYAKRKKNPSYENRFKKPVDVGRPNSNHNPFRSSPETNNPLGKVHRSATKAMAPFNVPPMVLSGTQPV
ncbi:MAG: hypothetical protein ACPGGL_00425 [Phycisphaerales bacterium]